MAQVSTRITLPSSPSDWKQYIRDQIPRPSIGVFVALVVVTGLSLFPTALSNLGESNGLANGTPATAEDHIVLLGEIPKFDWQNAEEVSVQWSLYGMGRYKLQLSHAPPGSYVPPNVAMDIYIDNPSHPVFSYDPAELLPLTELHAEGSISTPSVYSFKTESETLGCKPQHYIPHDCYSLEVFGFAVEKETNDSMLLLLRLSGSRTNDFDAVSLVLQSSTNFTRIVGGQLATTEVDSSKLFSNITRSKRAKAFTYSLFTINWLLALCSIAMTAFSFRQKGKGKYSLALVPITVILAIPPIRSFYPGAPPLGVFIDRVGFFPQMISVALCIAAIVTGFAVQHSNGTRPATGPEDSQMGAPLNEPMELVDVQRSLPTPS